MMSVTLRGTPDAGNPHVAPTRGYGGTGRFDEGEVARANPQRGSLLYKWFRGFRKVFGALALSPLLFSSASFGAEADAARKVPVTRELEYVKSTGQQIVDTKLVPGTTTAAEMRFGQVTYVNSTAFFGQN